MTEHRSRPRHALRATSLAAAVALALSGGALAQTQAPGASEQPSAPGEQLPAPLRPPAQRGAVPPFVKEQHGDWRIICDSAEGPGAARCALNQYVESYERPGFGVAVMVFKTPDNKTRMRVGVPTGVELGAKLGLQIDEQKVGAVPFRFCEPSACWTEAVVEDQLLGQLKSGQNAIFIFYELFAYPERGTGLPVSLNGFTDGFDALTVWQPPQGQSGAGGQSFEAPAQDQN